MKSKYINTFDTTAEYNNYIESALPAFPNVGYDKEADKVNIVRTSPNDHLFYGELVDATQNIPEIQLYNNYSKVKTYTPTVDTLTNTFYIDDWDTVPTFNKLGDDFLKNNENIKTIMKFKGLDTSKVTDMSSMFYMCSNLTSVDLSDLDTSNVTNMNDMFYYCSSLTSLDLSNFDTSKVTRIQNIFRDCRSLISLDISNFDISNVIYENATFSGCSSLKDVYINSETILMHFTNNLTSQGINYIPSSATIHYNGVDYKWNGSAWTQQN